MLIQQQIEEFLSRHNRQMVALVELEALCSAANGSYMELATALLALEAAGTLQMVKAKGRNGKQPALAYQYRIDKATLKRELGRLLQLAQLQLHSAIRLELYYSQPIELWLRDEPFIRQVDIYLRQHGLPQHTVPAPERSFALVGDEKWLTEHGGLELLERIGLLEPMRIIPVADPLMLAVNPRSIGYAKQLHLIVENKTTYQGLLQALPDTAFTTLIYGCGKKIVKSIEQFQLQLPLPSETTHTFYYFGDIDREGIQIWHSLQRRMQEMSLGELRLALPFYQACLTKAYALGKAYQRQDEQALTGFLHYFDGDERESIQACLNDGGYYPQEALPSAELKELWRTAAWMTISTEAI
jgi:hypothetical protein